MKKRRGKRHTPEQIIRKLREADTMLVECSPKPDPYVMRVSRAP